MSLQGTMIVIHGPPKIGKTQLASKFPGPVKFFATEQGHRYLPEKYQKILVRVKKDDWPKFRSEVRKLRKSKPKPKTVTVDVIDKLYTCCLDFVCDKQGWNHPEDAGHGKGWAAVRREFMDALLELTEACEDIGATLIFISHTKDETIETRTGKFTRLMCTMSGQARSMVLDLADHIWFLGYDVPVEDATKHPQTERRLWLMGSEAVEAGTRDDDQTATQVRKLSKTKPYAQILTKLKGKE